MTAPLMTQGSPPTMRRFGPPACPKCSDVLLAPAVSEHVNENIVRHFWACESCGHEFETTVRLFSKPSRRRAVAFY